MFTKPTPFPTNPNQPSTNPCGGCVLLSSDVPLLRTAIDRVTQTTGADLAIARRLRDTLNTATIVAQRFDIPAVAIGSRVTWMVSGGGAQTGTLLSCENPPEDQRIVDLHSMLGATLVGRVPLVRTEILRSDGGLDVLVVLNVEN